MATLLPLFPEPSPLSWLDCGHQGHICYRANFGGQHWLMQECFAACCVFTVIFFGQTVACSALHIELSMKWMSGPATVPWRTQTRLCPNTRRWTAPFVSHTVLCCLCGVHKQCCLRFFACTGALMCNFCGPDALLCFDALLRRGVAQKEHSGVLHREGCWPIQSGVSTIHPPAQLRVMWLRSLWLAPSLEVMSLVSVLLTFTFKSVLLPCPLGVMSLGSIFHSTYLLPPGITDEKFSAFLGNLNLVGKACFRRNCRDPELIPRIFQTDANELGLQRSIYFLLLFFLGKKKS